MTEHSVEIADLAAALSAAQAEFSAIPKGSDNDFYKSKYADLADVVKGSAPVTSKHGLSVSQWVGFDEKGDVLTTVLLHKSGQFISDVMRLHATKTDRQGNVLPPDPQSLGSATTYGRRQAYMAALGLVADVDDDANKASGKDRASASSTVTVPQPEAKQPERTEAAASAKQRGLIFGRASEKGMSSSQLANVLKATADLPAFDWPSEEAAHEWLQKQLSRMPASRVDAVLAGIESAPGQLALAEQE
jgi:hypothetical protein